MSFKLFGSTSTSVDTSQRYKDYNRNNSRKATSSNEGNARKASSSDVSLRFRVDAETHDVNVLVVDKGSGKVIRSVPPEELAELQEGDLVDLFG
ncbi:MAG: hypothetical protein DWQ07_05285 [Chloroflexi bacterium]|nr:MAG: hypothetical protein DWQ07_05285 [Chloroflexota bacterium]MBL1194847.1 hypothetical protein [Chloroflexota bacterium]NOH12138.1 hypothetical protein [Chloroflexota bacterium]